MSIADSFSMEMSRLHVLISPPCPQPHGRPLIQSFHTDDVALEKPELLWRENLKSTNKQSERLTRISAVVIVDQPIES